ncbi:uncharacterized protein LOC129619370 [Condylostylus longicornis]|uniref:uncharacterized protein LOC129619370 n=1 Tax=Condylostylus longicornis TaxID=2530218 RepID=UPI00244DF07D|nr:uncharacterized protein LOC129619370 [Condylostylus longicornis]
MDDLASKQVQLDIWAEFQENHKSIEDGTQADHMYFTEKVKEELQSGSSVENEEIKIFVRGYQRNIVKLMKIMNNVKTKDQSRQYYEINIQHLQTKWDEIQKDERVISSRAEYPENYGYDVEEFEDTETEVQNLIITLSEELAKLSEKNNQSLRDVEKMYYLNSNLMGEPLKLIGHLAISEANYKVAWKILEDRYDNARLLISTILDKFINQPSLVAGSARSLKSMFDTTKECILLLKNVKVIKSDSWDPILLHILYKKLDKDTHTIYEQTLKSPRQIQSLDEFMKFLELRFQSFEALGAKSYATKQISKKDNNSHSFTVIDGAKCAICHNTKTCYSRGCRKCNKKHNTLLHDDYKVVQNKPQINTTVNMAEDNSNNYVFLGTVQGIVLDKHNKEIECRILLDSGSQINFISERLRKRLQLEPSNQGLSIYGIGKTEVESKGRVNLTINSRINNFSTNIEARVIKEITSLQPQRFINISTWNIPQKVQLADPNFNKPQRVDVLLGAEMFSELLRIGQIKLNKHLPMFQNTVFGWIVIGKVHQEVPFAGVSNSELENQLQRFWEVEDIGTDVIMKPADVKCEEYFMNTSDRDQEGRFVVNLPILGSPGVLGESKNIAFRRFLNLEKKLGKDVRLKQQYIEFLEDYLKLGHMKEVNEVDIPQIHYFMPHHGVWKPNSSTTKLRVVFDASYQNLQMIMWRSDPRDRIHYFKLTTVTYGTKAAPYLATRCLKQLSADKFSQYPLAAKAIKDFYVDDVITGCNSLTETIELKKQLISMLKTAKFHLHKWSSNNDKIMEDVVEEDREKEKVFEKEESGYIKTLVRDICFRGFKQIDKTKGGIRSSSAL